MWQSVYVLTSIRCLLRGVSTNHQCCWQEKSVGSTTTVSLQMLSYLFYTVHMGVSSRANFEKLFLDILWCQLTPVSALFTWLEAKDVESYWSECFWQAARLNGWVSRGEGSEVYQREIQETAGSLKYHQCSVHRGPVCWIISGKWSKIKCKK